MKYTLTEPCDECPFLVGSGFVKSNLMRHASGEFACHKTCYIDEETGNYEPRKNSPHCAGALILLEKRNKPHQMMRICERLGLYDRRKLNMDAKVQ
jgi:hypothetical protein